VTFWENSFDDLQEFIGVKWGERQALIYQEYQSLAQLASAIFGDGKKEPKVVESADQLAALFGTTVRSA